MNDDSRLESPRRDAPDVKAPSTVDELKDALRLRHKQASERLARLRKDRDKVNEQIREAVVEEAEAARIVKALEPRKRKP